MANDARAVVAAAQRLAKKDEAALELLLGLREKAIEKDPKLKDNPEFEPKYDGNTMGPLDEIKKIGRRVLARWNKELHKAVCTNNAEKKKVLEAMNLGQAAVIAVVATALSGLGVAAAIAAAVAPLIVKRFIEPAQDELCEAWGESIKRG